MPAMQPVTPAAERPLVMGILNVTPDSFYDGGAYPDASCMLQHCGEMLAEGADWIDVGGCSTRPDSSPVDAAGEWRRVDGALRQIRQRFPEAKVSVDTFRADVARRAVTEYGVQMVNDISGGGGDPHMLETMAGLNVAYVLSHHPSAENAAEAGLPVVERVRAFFGRMVPLLQRKGVDVRYIDPGFGFGKTLEENYALLRHLDELTVCGLPLLVGLSRKSMVYKVLQTTPDKALSGTLALEMLALEHGAGMLRVHDVKATADLVRVYGEYASILL